MQPFIINHFLVIAAFQFDDLILHLYTG